VCIFCAPVADSQKSSGLKKYIFALGLKLIDPILTHAYRSKKEVLLNNLSGTILETGPGSGLNFRFYAKGSTVIAIEPNRYLHPFLKKAAARNGLSLELHTAAGEAMNLLDNSADAAVTSLVLCSVSNPDKVVSEIRRVLKPGGRFVFIEHVLAQENTRLQRFQKMISPLWQKLFDGCHPDRNALRHIENAGFSIIRAEDFKLTVPVVSPHISGTAIK
jgi:ubiquinone/menaquinone biosynthesis C-methylase UbiE